MLMVKRSKSTKRNISINTVALWLAVGLIVVVQIFILFQIKDMKTNQTNIGKRLVADLINKTETERYRTPAISISEDRVYIPEVKGYVPLTNISRDIRYDYFDMKGVEVLYLSYNGIVGKQNEHHTSANCDKVAAITKNKNEMSDFTYVQAISPIGPGLMHIYRHNNCNFYPEELSDDIARIATALRSY